MTMHYQTYAKKMKLMANLNAAIGLLHWDTEVNMPPGSAGFRAGQIAVLSGMSHEMFTEKEFGELVEGLLENDALSEKEKRNLELSFRDYEKEVKLSREFVEELSSTSSAAFQAWDKAKKENDYSLFAPHLEKLIRLKLREAEIRGYQDHPYDALLDLYEPELKVSFLDDLFQEAKSGILQILDDLRPENHQVDDAFFRQHYPKDKQWDFTIEMLKGIGYDFNHGRQDISSHPFSISFSPQDVRVTTRVDENDFAYMCWSCLHEAGHAMYEQGLPFEDFGLPSGSSVSLGIHESQSRLWENHVGRSREFWEHWFPRLKAYFPDQLKKTDLEAFYLATNKLQPNLIRTEADELHYHLHVIIRYELEKDLLSHRLSASEVRDAWNAKYREYLGKEPEKDGEGILQDVHWSHGSFGYFPTYSLGSFYAAQIYQKALETIEGLDKDIAKGDCSGLLQWLNRHIHSKGRLLDPADLCRSLTGEELNVSHFLDYSRAKYQSIYPM